MSGTYVVNWTGTKGDETQNRPQVDYFDTKDEAVKFAADVDGLWWYRCESDGPWTGEDVA